MHTIVVGTDGSEGAAAALRWATHEARLHGASVTALLAWTSIGHAGSGIYPDFDEADATDTVRHWLDIAGVGDEVRAAAVFDLPVSALVEASGTADLVVVGSRGRGGFRELLLGSVSSTVAERALSPVAVVRETGRQTGPVVVGVDGSAHAARPLQWAADEARARGVDLEIVHAWSGGGAEPILGLPMLVPLSHHEEAAERELTAAMDAVDLGGIAVHRHVVADTPAGALIEPAKRACMVAVGSRGRGGLTSVLLGSTSRHLLHHAACPVVVVR